jgi:transposase
MPFKESSIVLQREEFRRLALEEGANVSELCRRFGVGRTSAYLWLGRYEAEGLAGLANRSRRPKLSPRQTPSDVEEAILALRADHPCWGGRKLRKVLERSGGTWPSASTITEYCGGTASSTVREQARRGPMCVSSTPSRTTCGRWISRVISRCAKGGAIR